jgi:hypothetical protein
VSVVSAEQINRYRPRQELKWEENDERIIAQIYTEYGIVEFFTYFGGEHGKPFTTLGMYIAPHRYHARLPRSYGRRWVRRVCGDFAWECDRKAMA